jgi:hypothetical protein
MSTVFKIFNEGLGGKCHSFYLNIKRFNNLVTKYAVPLSLCYECCAFISVKNKVSKEGFYINSELCNILIDQGLSQRGSRAACGFARQ